MDHLRPPVRYQGQRLQLGLLLAASSSGSPRIIPAAAGCKEFLLFVRLYAAVPRGVLLGAFGGLERGLPSFE
jgi:hypothetical protein